MADTTIKKFVSGENLKYFATKIDNTYLKKLGDGDAEYIASVNELGGIDRTSIVKATLANFGSGIGQLVPLSGTSDAGKYLKADGTWGTPAGTYSLPNASTNTLGGIKVGYTQSGKNYPVVLDGSYNAYVNVPWTDTNTTYKAGNGLSLDATSNTFSINNSITATTAASLLKVKYNAQGLITGTSAVAKADITALLGAASSSADGYMTSAQVKQLNTAINNAAQALQNFDVALESTDTDNGVAVTLGGSVGSPAVQVAVNLGTLKTNLGLSSAMVFKGTLGTTGTISTLPTPSASNAGFTYKVINDGTYAGVTAKVGDVFTSNGTEWIYIPSGDEPLGTVTNVNVAGINGITTTGSPITSSGTITVKLTPVTGTAAATDETTKIATVSNTGGITVPVPTKKSINGASVGSATKGVYINADGTPTACTYSLAQNVTASSKLTDTWIAFVGATASTAGTAGYIPAPAINTIGVNTCLFGSDGAWMTPMTSAEIDTLF